MTFTARGNSMRPWIPDGSSVTIAPMDTPRVGDIALALFHGQPILHRIFEVKAQEVVLGGDLNGAVQRCNREDIVGVAVSCQTPQGRRKKLRRHLLNRIAVLAFAPIRLRKRK